MTKYGAVRGNGAPGDERHGKQPTIVRILSLLTVFIGVSLLSVGALTSSLAHVVDGGGMVTRALSLGSLATHPGDFEGEFELPEDLDAYIEALEFSPDVYAALGSAGPGESVPGVTAYTGNATNTTEDAINTGVVISTEGGRNATLLRIKLFKEHLLAQDAENLHENDIMNAIMQASLDEGATQPAPVNVASYQKKLQREIEQDNQVLEAHDAMLAARAAARLGNESASLGGNAPFCWRDSYGRGVGKIPNYCPSHKETIAGGVFCYTKCNQLGNFYRFGYDCHQRCGSGFNDHGLLCNRGNWGRGVGEIRCGWEYWASDSSALGEHSSSGRRLLGGGLKTKLVCGGSQCGSKQDCLGLCYPRCPSSHPNWIGCNLCGVDCTRSGYNPGIAPSCPKKIYCSHGMEAAKCAPGYEYDAGLCYSKCRSGYNGVGPVCWGFAPTVEGKKWVECGMGAAIDDVACASAVADQILGPLEMVAFVASFGSSGAATTGPKAAARAAKTAAKSGGKLDALKDAAKSLKKTFESNEYVKKAKKVNDRTDVKAAKKANKALGPISDILEAKTETDGIRAAAELAAVFDPTGVSSTVAAYTFETCDKLHGVAQNKCDETVSGYREKGYRGCQTKTVNGRTCQAWNSQSPHRHGNYKPGSEYDAGNHNYCRNPDNDGGGIWCYTTDPNKRWEYCNPL